MKSLKDACTSIFLSTPSARRATENCRNYFLTQEISIHALREEGDEKHLPAKILWY